MAATSATLADHLGRGELVDRHVDPGDTPGQTNARDKLVASALAGGSLVADIGDADVLRTSGTADVIGSVVKAPSTLGMCPRSFRWGYAPQLDRVGRELWAEKARSPPAGIIGCNIDLKTLLVTPFR